MGLGKPSEVYSLPQAAPVLSKTLFGQAFLHVFHRGVLPFPSRAVPVLHHEAWGASRTACRPLVRLGPCYSWVCSDLILAAIKCSQLQSCWEALKHGFSMCWWEGRAGQ